MIPKNQPIQQQKQQPKQGLNITKIKADNNKSKTNKSLQGIIIFSSNAAGVVNEKLESINAEVKAMNANIVTVQETHTFLHSYRGQSREGSYGWEVCDYWNRF